MVRECVSSQAHRKTDSFCKSFGGVQCHLNLSWYRNQEKSHSIVNYYAEPVGQRFEMERFRSPGEGKFLFLALSSSYCLVGPVILGQWNSERLHPLVKPVVPLALEAVVQPLLSLTPHPSDTGDSLPRGNPSLTHSPLCLPMSSALWRKRGAA